MFTGIIRSVSPVVSIRTEGVNTVARIRIPENWQLDLGQSVAIDGVCSTITKKDSDTFEVDWMPETLAKTTAGSLKEGSMVNLERSLTLQDFVDGHLVQGHVDGRGTVTKIEKDTQEGTVLSVSITGELIPFIAKKGSVAINGVSLTVTAIQGSTLSVALIPYTLEHTNLGLLKEGDEVNIEVDMMARYIQNHANKK